MLSVAPPSLMPRSVPGAESYILLVDDHEPSLRRLAEVIKNSGYRCVAAESGTEALRWCDRGRPRVVVTDLSMPNLDGHGLARWLQARYPSVPLILVSGQEFDQRTLEEMRRTFTAVLSKPIDIGKLLDHLDRLMPPRRKHDRDAGRP